MTQEDLAVVLKISQPAISKYLKKRIPPAEVLLNLAMLGDTTIEWILIGRTDSRKSNPRHVSEKALPEYNSDRDLSQAISMLPEQLTGTLKTLIEQILISEGKNLRD